MHEAKENKNRKNTTTYFVGSHAMFRPVRPGHTFGMIADDWNGTIGRRPGWGSTVGGRGVFRRATSAVGTPYKTLVKYQYLRLHRKHGD